MGLDISQILIHTSVKLVTILHVDDSDVCRILIHTSVKLVTSHKQDILLLKVYFNPHEREARDENICSISVR